MTADKLIQIVATALDVDAGTLTEKSSPITVEGWDSIRHLMLMSMVEETYSVTFSPEEIEKAMSVAKLRALLTDRGVV